MHGFLVSQRDDYPVFWHPPGMFKDRVRNMADTVDLSSIAGCDGHDSSHISGGSSLYSHEQAAINEIRSEVQRRQIGRMVSNLDLFDEGTRRYLECDIILTATTGLYVVELKHWSGHVRIDPYNWEREMGRYVESPHRANQLKCKVLKSMYQHHFKAHPDIWVESIVVLTNPDSEVEGASSPKDADEDKHNLTFASISDFVKYLLRKRSMPDSNLLTDQQVSAIAAYLENLGKPARGHEYTVQGYKNVEYLYQTPNQIEFVARPIEGRIRGLKRFRVFREPKDGTQVEREQFRKKALNTLYAVSDIGDHPNVHVVTSIPNDYGDIIEMSDWSDTGTLRDWLNATQGNRDPKLGIELCRGVACALAVAHEASVIHRAVRPENILVMNGIPKLMNFDLSYQVEDDRLTVMPAASTIRDDGYVAPEILSGSDIDESTDFFSLGVIAYEILAGCKPFASVRQFSAEGGMLCRPALNRLVEKEVPQKTIDMIEKMVLADRNSRTKDAESIIAVFSGEPEQPNVLVSPSVHNAELQPGDEHDAITIVELIAKGKTSQVYRAKGVGGRNVALKLFNREVPRETIVNECSNTHSIRSSYVVACDGRPGYWKSDRYFIVLDYVDGESMRRIIERGQRPEHDSFRAVANALMQAVRAFHERTDAEGSIRPLLHNDIKPDNVLITCDHRAVLIDCGISSEPGVGMYAGSSGYVPPDSILGTDMQFSQSGDLFALGVTLWEWLFGSKPYVDPSIGDTPDTPENARNYALQYVPWLQKAVATEVCERFASIREMQDAFQRCGTTAVDAHVERDAQLDQIGREMGVAVPPAATHGAEQHVAELQPTEVVAYNPFVRYLNSLSSVSAANENAMAESQIASDFFNRIRVKNPVTAYAYDMLINKQTSVILTGNAGDGKTTIAADIIHMVTGSTPRSLQAVERIASANLVIVKDMSELKAEERSEALRGAVEDTANRYLIVSNTGTLLESFRHLTVPGVQADESELLRALESNCPEYLLDGRFLMVNIARTDSIETACETFVRMLDADNWRDCEQCSHLVDCPISRNASFVRGGLELVRNRISLAYRRMYEYDCRLTMRQMTGHLAYAITAGLDCEDVAHMSYAQLEEARLGVAFFNRFFGDDGSIAAPAALQLMPVRRLAETEFGAYLDPVFERGVWRNPELIPMLSQEARDARREIYDLHRENAHAARRQMRRLAYFFGWPDAKSGDRYVSSFLRSPAFLDYLSYSRSVTQPSPTVEAHYRSQVLRVLQEHILGVRLPSANSRPNDLYVTLGRPGSGAGTQMVVGRLRHDDFAMVVEPRYRMGGSLSGRFCLLHRPTDVTLPLDLPFLDYVLRRHGGEIAEELSANYVNRLDRFKVELLDAVGSDCASGGAGDSGLTMLRIGSDYELRTITIRRSGNSLEVA